MRVRRMEAIYCAASSDVGKGRLARDSCGSCLSRLYVMPNCKVVCRAKMARRCQKSGSINFS